MKAQAKMSGNVWTKCEAEQLINEDEEKKNLLYLMSLVLLPRKENTHKKKKRARENGDGTSQTKMVVRMCDGNK